jgi:hypothetical protein
MRTARVPARVIAVASLLLLPAVLTACTKPSPGATVFSGGSSAYREAACWTDGDTGLDASNCTEDLIAKASDGEVVGKVSVVPGSTVGISVDPVVADAGWYPVIGNQRLVDEPITSTYYRFTYPDMQSIPEGGTALQIIAGAEKAKGIWVFSLVK